METSTKEANVIFSLDSADTSLGETMPPGIQSTVRS